MFQPYPDVRTWAQAMRDALTFEQCLAIHRNNAGLRDAVPGTEADVGWGYFGSPPAVHFVGFRGNEYRTAVALWGAPDFIHRSNDQRFRVGGDVAPHDTVIYANGAEARPKDFSFDDSAVAPHAFDKASGDY